LRARLNADTFSASSASEMKKLSSSRVLNVADLRSIAEQRVPKAVSSG